MAYWTLRKESPATLTHLSHGGGHGLWVSQPGQHLWCRWTNIHIILCLAFHVRASYLLYRGMWGGKVGKEGVCLHPLLSFKLLPSPAKGGYRIPLNLCILGWLFLSGRAEPGSTSLSQTPLCPLTFLHPLIAEPRGWADLGCTKHGGSHHCHPTQ